ncbi:hypothetical protein HOG47_02890 [archaeon]|jgi:hypothetical protein|nr:hypothetical protein [archaeon]MBT5491099.1 hypothetical protein [bacterium]
MNLLEETIYNLDKNNKNIDDVAFVNFNKFFDVIEKEEDNFSMEWNEFAEYAEDNFFDYKPESFGVHEVPKNATVVFKDGTWLERKIYEGQEQWTYKKIPNRY